MELKEVIKNLEELKNDCAYYESIETKDTDVVALSVAIDILKRNSQIRMNEESGMELKIKVSINTVNEISDLLKEIRKIKEECPIISTLLLEINVTH